jgi:hypothetical protein
LTGSTELLDDTPMNVSRTALLLLLLSTNFTSDRRSEADAAKAAEAYLSALTGTGDDSARELLLGGVTMDAQISSLENWRIVSKEPFKTEEGDLGRAVQLMNELDRVGDEAVRKMMNEQAKGSGMKVAKLSQADAAKLLAPTKEKTERFSKACPVLAYVARVGKELRLGRKCREPSTRTRRLYATHIGPLGHHWHRRYQHLGLRDCAQQR